MSSISHMKICQLFCTLFQFFFNIHWGWPSFGLAQILVQRPYHSIFPANNFFFGPLLWSIFWSSFTHVTHCKSCWTFCVGSYTCTTQCATVLLADNFKPKKFPNIEKSPSLLGLPQPFLQSLGLPHQACKLAGKVEQRGGYNFSIKRKKKKLNSRLSNQVHNPPFWISF